MKKIALVMGFAALALFAGENEIPQHRLPTPDRFEFPETAFSVSAVQKTAPIADSIS